MEIYQIVLFFDVSMPAGILYAFSNIFFLLFVYFITILELLVLSLWADECFDEDEAVPGHSPRS
jgi:hypothetical protein